MTKSNKQLTGCINCGLCNVCPTGVDIATCLTIYDKSLQANDKAVGQLEYMRMIKFMRAHNCIECGRCLKKCPVEIDIIDRLKDVANYFEV